MVVPLKRALGNPADQKISIATSGYAPLNATCGAPSTGAPHVQSILNYFCLIKRDELARMPISGTA